MIIINIPINSTKFNSYEATIEYLERGGTNKVIVSSIDYNELVKSIKKEIKTHKASYHLSIINREWKSKESYSEFNSLPYNDPITGMLVWPNKQDNVFTKTNVYNYDIINNKLKAV